MFANRNFDEELQEARSLGGFLHDMARLHADSLCEIDAETGRERTFRSVSNEAIRLSEAMTRECSLQTNDYVMFYSLEPDRLTVPLLATLYLGLKVCLLPPSFLVDNVIPERMVDHIKNIRPRVLFTETLFIETHMKLIIHGRPNLNYLIVIKMNGPESYTILYPESTVFIGLELKNNINFELYEVRPVDLETEAVVFYTKGLTSEFGKPKPVCVSHLALLKKLSDFLDIQDLDLTLSLHANTITCASAFVLFLAAFKTGNARLIVGPHMHVDEFLYNINTYDVTMADTGRVFLEDFDIIGPKLIVPNLLSLVISGTRATLRQIDIMRELAMNADLFVAYIVTEALGYATMKSYAQGEALPGLRNVYSVGNGLRYDTFKILDMTTNEELVPLETGKIYLRTPNNMMHYHPFSELIPTLHDDFFETGDVGYRDKDNIYIFNKIEDCFKFNGKYIYPGEIDAALEKHDRLKQVALVCVDTPLPVCAAFYLVPHRNERVNQGQLFGYAKLNLRHVDLGCLAGGVVHVPRLPRTKAGWVCRTLLGKRFNVVDLE